MTSRPPTWPVLALLACVAGTDVSPASAARGQAPRDSSAFERGYRAYMDFRFADSRPLFEQAVAESVASSRAHAWLGYAWFRTEQPERAWSEARVALALDSCNTAAWEVLNRALNPQYGAWERANADSAWACVLAGVRCDSLDGELAEDVWIGALERGDDGLARRSVRWLDESRLLGSPLLAYARWLLADLPPHAILIVNGDADCYPVLVVQDAEGLRPDVSMVHISLLALPWYRRYVRDQLGVPMPFEPATLDTLEWRPDGTNGWISPSRELVKGWMRMLDDRSLARPLVMSVTVEEKEVPDQVELGGAWWRLDPQLPRRARGELVDTASTRRGLLRLRAEELVGEPVSEATRSPFMRASRSMIPNNILSAVYYYYLACRREGADRDAEDMRARALRLLVPLGASPAALASVRALPARWKHRSRERSEP
jgi:hypothetical protein